MFNLITGCNLSSKNNWFFTKIFEFEDISIDQQISFIYPVDENIILLFGSDENKIALAGLPWKEESLLFFRSTDGGKTFKEEILDKGSFISISCSVDKKSLYVIYSGYSDENTSGLIDQYQILKSSNKGETWEKLFLFKDKGLNEVFFFDETIGFAYVVEDPIGYNFKTLYKTIDGGKTWVQTFVNLDGCFVMSINADKKFMGQYSGNRELAVWTMDIDSLQIERIELEVDKEFHIYGVMVIDKLTGEHYVVLESKKTNSYSLYNIEREEIVKLPDYPSKVHIYGDYIGVFVNYKWKAHRTTYSYSLDRGKTWKKETPSDNWLHGTPAMFGMGHAWVMTIGNRNLMYPLMVRVPTSEENEKAELIKTDKFNE